MPLERKVKTIWIKGVFLTYYCACAKSFIHNLQDYSMVYKVDTITELRAAIEKSCPILLCVPDGDVPTLSDVFNDKEMTDDRIQMKNYKTWVKEHKKGNHAVIKTQNWDDFENSLMRISGRGLSHKLDIGYAGRVISLNNAFMRFGQSNILDESWGNGTGAYILYQDQQKRIGMARLFNEEGHVRIKIPYLEKGHTEIQWNDITPSLPDQAVKKEKATPFTFIDHASQVFE